MKTLSPQTFVNARAYIFTHCSELLRQRWLDAFEAPNPTGVLRALAAYQNADGGYGHNLEGDFALPDSSPMATSVAFQILTDFGAESDEPLVQGGIAYLLKTYLPERPGWLSVPPIVNDYPHASWWHYRPELGGTVIDRAWANPSAELVGYLARYRDLVPAALLDVLLAHTLETFRDFDGPMDMHLLYCFIKFARQLPEVEVRALQPKLTDLVLQEVCTDRAAWSGYCAQPLDFVDGPQSFLYPFLAEAVQANLDYRIESLGLDGVALVPWNWQDGLPALPLPASYWLISSVRSRVKSGSRMPLGDKAGEPVNSRRAALRRYGKRKEKSTSLNRSNDRSKKPNLGEFGFL